MAFYGGGMMGGGMMGGQMMMGGGQMMMGGGMMGGGVVTVFQQPTTFQIRSNFFAFGGELDIFANGMPMFRCITVPSPFGFHFYLTDMYGNQLCNIQQDMSLGMPQFHIYLRGCLYGTLRQLFTGGSQTFELRNCVTGEYVIVQGDWLGRNFMFQERGMLIGQALGALGTESYNVTVSPGVDSLFILASTLTIDKLVHEFSSGMMGGMPGMMGMPMMGFASPVLYM